jgi:hypothetical protein
MAWAPAGRHEPTNTATVGVALGNSLRFQTKMGTKRNHHTTSSEERKDTTKVQSTTVW